MYFQKFHCAMPIFDNKSVFIDEESLGQIIKQSFSTLCRYFTVLFSWDSVQFNKLTNICLGLYIY